MPIRFRPRILLVLRQLLNVRSRLSPFLAIPLWIVGGITFTDLGLRFEWHKG